MTNDSVQSDTPEDAALEQMLREAMKGVRVPAVQGLADLAMSGVAQRADDRLTAIRRWKWIATCFATLAIAIIAMIASRSLTSLLTGSAAFDSLQSMASGGSGSSNSYFQTVAVVAVACAFVAFVVNVLQRPHQSP